MNRRFLEAVLKGKWLIDPGYLMDNRELIHNIITGKTVVDMSPEEDLKEKISASKSAFNSLNLDYYDNIPEGSIAITPVMGSLFKYNQYCGPRGMNTLGNAIKAADAHQSISAHLLIIDSPGGTVDGTETLGSIVKNTEKPVIAFVDGLMASAALWIGSAADEIYASTEMDEVGSVGVLLSFADVQPMMEKQGVKFHTITADQSKDKVKMWEDLRAGKYDEYKEAFLNPIAQKFQEVVKENRQNVTDDQLTGKVYLARDVVGSFIDGIMTLDEALARASELGKSSIKKTDPIESADINEPFSSASKLTSQKPEKSNTTKTMKNYAHINKALGVESLESADGFVSLSEEQLSALDTLLGANATVASELETVQGDLAKANKSIEEKDALIASHQEEVKSLKEAAAGGGAVEKSETEVGDKKTEEKVKSEENTFMKDLQEVEEMTKQIL